MLVHVSLLHTDGFRIEGSVPEIVISFLKSEFGTSNVKVENEEELIDPYEEDWFKETMNRLTPGKNLKFYRKQKKMTQQSLAKEIGTSKQAICAMEHDSRPISKKNAKLFATLFGTSPSRFI